MDESVTCTDEGKRSILKPRLRMPLQEVQSFFPDDDATVTCTLTKSRRVSFGRNLVKGFIVGSAADCEAVYEYEQSSESISEPSECSGPLDLALNKSVAVASQVPGTAAVTPHESSITRPPEERARLFTENCISIAKSVFHDTETELTAIIIGAKPTSMDSSCMSFTNLDMSNRFDNLCEARQPDFIAGPHVEMAKSVGSDKSRYDFLNGSLKCPNYRVNRPNERTPLSSLQQISPWDDEVDENVPPAHSSFRQQHQSITQQMSNENTMEFTCANSKRGFAINVRASVDKSSLNAVSDMEETCANAFVQPSHQSSLWDDTSDMDEIDDPLRLDVSCENFLSNVSAVENQSESDCSFNGIHQELANLSTVNRSFRQQLQTLNTTQSQPADNEEFSVAGSPLAVRLSPRVVDAVEGSTQPNYPVVEEPLSITLMVRTQSQEDEQDPFVGGDAVENVFSSPDQSDGEEFASRRDPLLIIHGEAAMEPSDDEDMEFTHCKRVPHKMIQLESMEPIEEALKKTILNNCDGEMEFTHCVRPGNWKSDEKEIENSPIDVASVIENSNLSTLATDLTHTDTEEDPFQNICEEAELFGTDMTITEADGAAFKGEGRVTALPVPVLVNESPAHKNNAANPDASTVEPLEEKSLKINDYEMEDNTDNAVEMELSQGAKKLEGLEISGLLSKLTGINEENDINMVAADSLKCGLGLEIINMSLNAVANDVCQPETAQDPDSAHVEVPPLETAKNPKLGISAIDTTHTLNLKNQIMEPLIESSENVSAHPEQQDDSLSNTNSLKKIQNEEFSTILSSDKICEVAGEPKKIESTDVELQNNEELETGTFAVGPVVDVAEEDDIMDMTVAACEKTQFNDEKEVMEAEKKYEAVNVTEVTEGVSKLPLHTPLAGLAALATRPSLRDKLETVPSDSTAASVCADPLTPMADNMRSMELSLATVSGLVKTMSDEQHMHAVCESTRIIETRNEVPDDRTFQANAPIDLGETFSVQKKLNEDTYFVFDRVTDSLSKRQHSDSPCPGERIKKTRPSFSPRAGSVSRSNLCDGESQRKGTDDNDSRNISTSENEHKDASPAKKRAMESPLPAERMLKRNRSSCSPKALKTSVQDAEISFTSSLATSENFDVSITLENMTLDEENSLCIRDETTSGMMHITPLQSKSFRAEKSYACQPFDKLTEELHEYSITQPVVSIPPVEYDNFNLETVDTHTPTIRESESINISDGTPPDEDADVFQRITNTLHSYALEKGCIWQLGEVRNSSDAQEGLIIVVFPLIASELILEIQFGGKNQQITKFNTQHRQRSHFQWRRSREINEFAFNALAEYIGDVGKKCQSLDQLPYCIDFFNAYAHKVKLLAQDLSIVLRGCASTRLKGKKLAIRLCSFPMLMMCWVELNLTDILVLGRPSISCQHEMGRLNEEATRKLVPTQAPVLQNFIKSAFRLIEDLESMEGSLTRRLPLLFE